MIFGGISMRKKVTLGIMAVILIMMTVFLSGCSHTFTCGLCGKEVNEAGHKQTVLGQEIEICNDCYNGLKSLAQ